MEFIIELLVELIIDGSIEISEDERVSKWIRYPIILVIVLLFSIVIFGLIILGIIFLKDYIYAGLFFIVIGVIMLIAGTMKFAKKYTQKRNIKED